MHWVGVYHVVKWQPCIYETPWHLTGHICLYSVVELKEQTVESGNCIYSIYIYIYIYAFMGLKHTSTQHITRPY